MLSTRSIVLIETTSMEWDKCLMGVKRKLGPKLDIMFMRMWGASNREARVYCYMESSSINMTSKPLARTILGLAVG